MHIPTIMPVKMKDALSRADFDWQSISSEDLAEIMDFIWSRCGRPVLACGQFMLWLKKYCPDLFTCMAWAVNEVYGKKYHFTPNDLKTCDVLLQITKKWNCKERECLRIAKLRGTSGSIPPCENFDSCFALEKHGKWDKETVDCMKVLLKFGRNHELYLEA
ncbi:Uncharacterised protein [uncultured archaeon]|nr:Uncharacterised protein [uncultured archaeon]